MLKIINQWLCKHHFHEKTVISDTPPCGIIVKDIIYICCKCGKTRDLTYE